MATSLVVRRSSKVIQLLVRQYSFCDAKNVVSSKSNFTITMPNWTKSQRIKLLVVGLIGTISMSAVGLKVLVFKAPPATESDLHYFKGQVRDLEYRSEGNDRGRTLVIQLDDVPLVFKSFSGVYPQHYDSAALSNLRQGVQVEVGILNSEKDKPRRVGVSGEEFYKILNLKVDGMNALTLESYNQWDAKNAAVGRIVLPILLGCSILLLVLGLKKPAHPAM